MAKKNDRGLLKGIASFTGSVAGSVEGAVEAVVEMVHQIGKPKEEPTHKDVRWEPTDVSYRGTLIGGACFVGGMWLFTGLLFFYFVYLKNYRAEVGRSPLPIAQHGTPLPPEPRLQSSPAQDLKSFRAKEDWELSHYYWIDKSKGQVAIPIEQAVQMLAQRGIPPAKTAPNPTNTRPAEGTRLTGFEGKVEPEPK